MAVTGWKLRLRLLGPEVEDGEEDDKEARDDGERIKEAKGV